MNSFFRIGGCPAVALCWLSLAVFCGCADNEDQPQSKKPPNAPPSGKSLQPPSPPPQKPAEEDETQTASSQPATAVATEDAPKNPPPGGQQTTPVPAEPTVDEPNAHNQPAEDAAEPATNEPGDFVPDEGDVPDSIPPREEPKPLEPPPEAEGLKRFVEGNDLWVDVKNKRVVLAGRIVQRNEQIPLELFACRKGTKEHEAIVAVDVTAFFVHACLVAAGGEFGHPVRFWTADRQPMYEAAEGCQVKVTVHWDDEDGGERRSASAQSWLYNSRSKSEMKEPWVFAGSQFYKPTPEDKPFYLAEDGDLICVSNFPSALLDVPVESSSEESHLLYRPLTENIPPIGTPVAIVLEPEPGLREPISAPRILTVESGEAAPAAPGLEAPGEQTPPE